MRTRPSVQQREVVHALFCLMPLALDHGPRSRGHTAQSSLEGLVDADIQWLKHRCHSRGNNNKFTFQSVNFVLNFIS